MEALNLSPDVLEWAAGLAGESLEHLAASVAKRPGDRARVVNGRLTATQAEKVAKRAGVPFGFLFLAKPPMVKPARIPDLRQTKDTAPLSHDFFEVLEDAMRKQQWYVEYLHELGAQPLPMIGKFRKAAAAKEDVVARDVASALRLSPADRAASPDQDAYFTLISERVEDLGVLVMKSGIVKSNTRRPLAVHEFRGFAIVDPLAPLVFINGRDAEVASVFTLLHELAHIWLGESGVSDLGSPVLCGTEKRCNAIAAEVLVPRIEFLSAWKDDPNIESLAKRFRVSRLVIARRARDLDKIDSAHYSKLAIQSTSTRSKSAGGSAYRTIPIRSSKRLTRALVGSAMAGQTLLRDAASLLNVKPDTVVALAREFERRC